jgi:hypothetical protein
MPGYGLPLHRRAVSVDSISGERPRASKRDLDAPFLVKTLECDFSSTDSNHEL